MNAKTDQNKEELIMAKTERLQVRISTELKAQLQELAEADGRNVSNYIEKLIMDAIKEGRK